MLRVGSGSRPALRRVERHRRVDRHSRFGQRLRTDDREVAVVDPPVLGHVEDIDPLADLARRALVDLTDRPSAAAGDVGDGEIPGVGPDPICGAAGRLTRGDDDGRRRRRVRRRCRLRHDGGRGRRAASRSVPATSGLGVGGGVAWVGSGTGAAVVGATVVVGDSVGGGVVVVVEVGRDPWDRVVGSGVTRVGARRDRRAGEHRGGDAPPGSDGERRCAQPLVQYRREQSAGAVIRRVGRSYTAATCRTSALSC